MKRLRIVAAVLMLAICLMATGCGKLGEMYQDIGIRYVQNIGIMSYEDAENVAKESGYRYSVIEDKRITINDGNNIEISLTFDESSNNEVVMNSFSYTDRNVKKFFFACTSFFNTYDYSTLNMIDKEVDSLASCEEFIFGTTSGVTVTTLTLSDNASAAAQAVSVEAEEKTSQTESEVVYVTAPGLYTDVFMPFFGRMDSLTFEQAKEKVRDVDYNVEITDPEGALTISSDDGDVITAEFCWDMNGNNTLYLLMYTRGDNRFYASSLAHIHEVQYYTDDSNGEKQVNKLSDCEKFLFGGIASGSSNSTEESYSISLRYGTLLEKKAIGDNLTIKAKIEPSYSNKATIDQNYYNIEDIIKEQGGTQFTHIDYWAVADMTDGSEQKVISFTLSGDTIQKIADSKIVANQMGAYVDDLYILPSLVD